MAVATTVLHPPLRPTPGRHYNFAAAGIPTFSQDVLPHESRGARLVEMDDTRRSYTAWYYVNAQDEPSAIFYTPK